MSEAQGISLPTVKFTTTIPDAARGKGRAGGESVFQKLMFDMPGPAPGKGKNAPTQFAWFFVPAEVPDTITAPEEREKAAKDQCSKLINRFTSIGRRIRKANPETHDYTFRKARDPEAGDGTGDWGVVVYRIAPGSEKGIIRKAA